MERDIHKPTSSSSGKTDGKDNQVKDGSPSPSQSAGSPSMLDPNYLLLKYGEAMARAGQLEGRVAELLKQTESLRAAAHSEQENQKGSVEQLKKDLAAKEQLISRLNTQNAMLRSELDQVKARVDSHSGRIHRRHSRRHHRRWWRLWR